MKLLILTLFFPFLFLSQKCIIKKPYVMDSLLVSRHDLPNRLTFEEAKIACQELGDGWRLPTKQEMIKICENKKIKGFSSQIQLINDAFYYEDNGLYYWTDQEYGSNYSWIYYKDESNFAITLKSECLYVRPVRNILWN